MKQAHVFSVSAVLIVICAVAHAMAAAHGQSIPALVSGLSQSVVWFVAGGVAVLSAAREARVAFAQN